MTNKQQRADAFLNASVRHQIYLERYNAGVVRRMIALLNRSDATLIERIRALDPESATRGRLEAQLEQTAALQARLARDLAAALQPEAAGLAAYEAEFITARASAAFGIRFDGPTQEQVRAAALSRPFAGVHLRFARLDEHLDEFGRRRGALIRDTIRQAFIQGRGVDETVRLLRGTRALNYRDGLLETSRRTTETIVRTALNHTATAAREEVYKLNSTVFDRVQWVSVIDARTSPVCQARDGETYPTGKGPRPPAHPNCRSTTVAIRKGSQPYDKLTYQQWLERQDDETVVEILGPTRAKLFREGELKLTRFVDESGKRYTLSELREREKDAFARAGL